MQDQEQDQAQDPTQDPAQPQPEPQPAPTEPEQPTEAVNGDEDEDETEVDDPGLVKERPPGGVWPAADEHAEGTSRHRRRRG